MPPDDIVADNCSCPCQDARFSVNGRALARFICHCRICQTLYKAPFADVTAFWGGAVAIAASDKVRFKRYRLPPALRRGTCVSCGAPVFGYLTIAPFVRLAFVPTRNLKGATDLPAPAIHIFYHRRVADVQDSLPKVSGYWRSELAVSRLVLRGIARGAA